MPRLGLFDSIVKLFKASDPTPMNIPAEASRNRSTEVSYGDLSSFVEPLQQMWRTDADRRACWQDIENMDDNDEIIAESLDVLMEAATGKLKDLEVESFYIHAQNPKVQQLLDALERKLGLKDASMQIIRRMLKHGNEFQEIIVGNLNGQTQILRLKGDFKSYQFFSNRDQYNNVNPNQPWVQFLENPIAGVNKVYYAPWQMVHWHYGELDRGIAKPKLKACRRNWKRLQLIEDMMGVARIRRAYSRNIHKVPVDEKDTPDQIKEKIERYKAQIQKKEFENWSAGRTNSLDNPLTAETDIFIPEDGQQRGNVETQDPKNEQLSNINDVEYARDRLICRVGVPKRYLNISESGGKLNSSGGDHEEQNFARKVRNIQNSFKKGIQYLCYLELWFHGINPFEKGNEFTIGMSGVNADDEYRAAQASLTNMQAAEIFTKLFDAPEEVYFRKMLNLSPNEIQTFGPEIKLREWPNPAIVTNAGGAPPGSKPGSNDSNGKPPAKPRQSDPNPISLAR